MKCMLKIYVKITLINDNNNFEKHFGAEFCVKSLVIVLVPLYYLFGSCALSEKYLSPIKQLPPSSRND